jgi:hypothetical protein
MQTVTAVSERIDKASAAIVADSKALWIELLKPKVLFAGTAKTKRTSSPAHATVKSVRIFLEITEVRDEDGTVRLTALLRNDGSWSDTRVFTGELVCGDDGAAALKLISAASDALQEAGPLLQLGSDNFDLAVDREGNSQLPLKLDGRALVYEGDELSVRLESVSDEQRTAEIAAITGQCAKSIAAVQEGRVYTGTITDRTKGSTTPWILRFTAFSESDGVVSAELLRPTSTDEKVEVSGNVIMNRYRAAGFPVRFTNFGSYPSDEMEILRDIMPFDLAPTEDGKLRGTSARLILRFEPAAPGSQPAPAPLRKKK